MRQILLLRHGRTQWNATARFQGQLDPPLDEVGRAQAAAVAPVLARRAPALLVTSDLSRAAATAAAVASATGLEPVPDARLREMALGSWEGRTREEIQAAEPAAYAAWVAGNGKPGDGESMPELGARVAPAAVEWLSRVPSGGVLIAATHGAAVRSAVGVLLELPTDQWWRLQALDNCRWATLGETGRGWRLVEYNAGIQDAAAPPDPISAPDAEPVGS